MGCWKQPSPTSFWGRTKKMLCLALPSSGTYIIQFSLQFWSMLFIGRLGEGYLGAAALANMTANLTGFSVGLGMAAALDTLCTQAFGARQFALVGLHCQRAMAILTLMCFPLAAIWSQTERLLLLLGIDEKIAALSGQYTHWLIIGMWPWFMFEAFRRFLQAQRIMWPIAVSAVIASGLNLFLNGMLVIVAGLGFDGAALATAISNWVLLLSLVCLVLARRVYRMRHRGVSYMVVLDNEGRSLSPSARLSSPSDGIGEEAFELTPSKPMSTSKRLNGKPVRRPKKETARNRHGYSQVAIDSSDEEQLHDSDCVSDPDSNNDDDVFHDQDTDMANVNLLREREARESATAAATLAPTSIAPVFILTSSPFADGGDPDQSWPSFNARRVFSGWAEFFRLGIPSAVAVFVEWGSFEVTSTLAARLGPVLLDTHTIFCQTVAVWYMPALGQATAATTLIGNALGANNAKEARAYAWLSLLWVFLYGLLNALFYIVVLRNWWAHLFTNVPAVQQSVYDNIPILIYYGVFDVTKCITMAVMRGCGRPAITVWGNVLSCVIVGYPLAFSLTFAAHGKLIGLWSAMSTAWLTATSVYAVVMLRTDWQSEADKALARSAAPGRHGAGEAPPKLARAEPEETTF